MKPTTPKFFPYDTARDFMSLSIALADWSATPVIGLGMEESIPAVNKPNTAPRPYPVQEYM